MILANFLLIYYQNGTQTPHGIIYLIFLFSWQNVFLSSYRLLDIMSTDKTAVYSVV